MFIGFNHEVLGFNGKLMRLTGLGIAKLMNITMFFFNGGYNELVIGVITYDWGGGHLVAT